MLFEIGYQKDKNGWVHIDDEYFPPEPGREMPVVINMDEREIWIDDNFRPYLTHINGAEYPKILWYAGYGDFVDEAGRRCAVDKWQELPAV